eukprot:366781-Amphidinium_carterae.1
MNGNKSVLRCGGELALEMGMGRGRVALQLFLTGASVVGVELIADRYALAVAALSVLLERYPERFQLDWRSDASMRIQSITDSLHFCEFRHGDFFQVVTEQELASASLAFIQVCMPPSLWQALRARIGCLSKGCRILSFEYLGRLCPADEPPLLSHLASPCLPCTWSPQRGHVFHCYRRSSQPWYT